MKIFLKIIGGLFALLLVAIIASLCWFQATYKRDFSSVPLPDIHASTDPAVIARGEYLANAVAHCSACHSPANYVQHHRLASNLQDLRGGFAMHAGPFGTYYPANLTSDRETGLGALSDGQIARAIRHGVGRDGRLAAFMKFAVGNMSNEDLTALVSYLRSLPAVSNAVPNDEWGILAKALSSKFNPNEHPTLAHVAPSDEPSIARGEYLANGPAFCVGCHTPADPMQGFAFTGARFSGNEDAEPDPTDPNFVFRMPNLTPDRETGIMAGWDEEQFVSRFRAGRAYEGSKMPWDNFKRMTDSDLRSLYRYLHSLPPTRHEIGAPRRER